MDIVDDAQLMKLAAHRPHPMLSVLNRTESIKPVILLLAALPGLIILESQPVDQFTSRWGLRAVDAISATNMMDAVAPGRVRSAAELRFQPPLATWLTVGAMYVLGPAHPLSPTIVSYFAAAGVLGMAYILLSRLAGPRVGFWIVVLLAGHPSGLELYRAPASVGLTLMFALIAWWGGVRHRDEADSAASVSLLIAGVALGLCLLSGGIAVFPVAGILAFIVCTKSGRVKSRHTAGHEHRRRKKRLTRTFVPLFAVLLTAFAVGGWWLLMMGNEFGWDFWNGWFTCKATSPLIDWTRFAETARSFFRLIGVFGVVSIVGFARAIRFRRHQDGTEPQKRMTLIVIWVIVAFCLYLANAAVSHVADWRSSLAAGFLLIPLLACGANLLDDVFQRRLGLNAVAVLTSVSLLGFVALSLWTDRGGLKFTRSLQMGAATAIAAVIACVLICRYASRTESGRRFAIGGCIGLLLICNVAAAIRMPYDGNRSEEREIKAFMAGIPRSLDVDRCLLISSSDSSTRLEFAMRSRWPYAEFAAVNAWNAVFRESSGESLGNRAAVAIEWMTAKEHPTKIDFPGFRITPIATPRYYGHKDLRAFHIRADGSPRKK